MGESACGLDCHVIRRSLSQVSFGRRLRPARGSGDCGTWLEEGAAGLREGLECGGQQGWPPSIVLPRARVDPSPFRPAPVCRSVSGDFLWHGISLGTPHTALGRGGGGQGAVWTLWRGEARGGSSAAAPQAFWRRFCCLGLGACCGEEGGRSRRSCAAAGVALALLAWAPKSGHFLSISD